jgi:hypothetical protein
VQSFPQKPKVGGSYKRGLSNFLDDQNHGIYLARESQFSLEEFKEKRGLHWQCNTYTFLL